MKKLLGWLTGDFFKGVGDTIDKVFTNDQERQEAKNEILKAILSKSHEIAEMQSEIIVSETKGNWLQRSWRPILMLSFGFIVIYTKFVAPAFGLPNTQLEPDFWELLRLGIGGYVIGRSAEKIVKDVASNIEFKKK